MDLTFKERFPSMRVRVIGIVLARTERDGQEYWNFDRFRSKVRNLPVVMFLTDFITKD